MSEIINTAQTIMADPLAVWSTVAAVAAAVAAAVSAIFAAIAAWISLQQADLSREQIAHDRRARKVEAAILQSPYLSEEFARSFKMLKEAFGAIDLENPLEEKRVHDKTSADAETKNSLLFVLNFWGRIATMHKEELLDHDVAERTLKRGYLQFIDYYKNYLDVHLVRSQYPDLLQLYGVWKKEEF